MDRMYYKNLSDQELWHYCGQNDMPAYNELFDRYAPKLYKLAFRYIENSMTAEELAMDMLFYLWQKRHGLTIGGEFSAYLFRSMRNRVIDHLRKNIPTTVSFDLLEGSTDLQAKQADHHLLSREAEQVFLSQLETLSPQRRKAFQLSRDQDLSYAEIAREMNLSVNTVENYMAAALSTLRKGMNDYTPISLLLICLSFSFRLTYLL